MRFYIKVTVLKRWAMIAAALVLAAGFGLGRMSFKAHQEALEAAAGNARPVLTLDLTADTLETGQETSAEGDMSPDPSTAPLPTDKHYETEPEDHPDPMRDDIRIEVVDRTRMADEPLRVLIYHTHTYEAYEPTPGATYKATERWRTKDERYNVVRLGAELKQLLETEYGMVVVHEKGAFEPPVLSTAYTRSLVMLEEYTALGETFDIYIDLHRDAYSEGMKNSNVVTVDGQPLARLMMLIGKGEGFDQKPNWEKNKAFAQRITDSLNAQVERLCYPVTVKTGRFNQHVSEKAVLVECGNNMNTLPEVLRTLPYLARAIAEAYE